METPFREGNHIFETQEPFNEEFIPEKIFERDEVFAKYTRYLQDIVDGFGPRNIFIYGDSGLGKTAVTGKMMEFLKYETKQRDIELTILSVNCNKYNSNYAVIRQLANDLNPDSNYRQGTHQVDLWDAIYTKMDEIGGEFLLILDEIDQLGTEDELLYDFPRARSMGEIENARVGVIGISNNYLYRDNLRTRVKSTLCESEIEFNPYNANQLNTILQYYADISFADGVLTDNVVPLCAAITAQETGDARMGLDLLQTAGSIARDDDANKVTDEHVDKARVEVERANVKEIFRSGLTIQQQLVLVTTTVLIIRRKQNVKLKTIYEAYCDFADQVDMDALTKRRVNDFVKILTERGLLEVDKTNLGGGGGRWYSYSTVVSPRTIIEAIEDQETRFDNIVTSDVKAELNRYENEQNGAIEQDTQARIHSSW